MTISESEILDQLDQCNADFVFPMLDNGYEYPITQRLNCFGDSGRWVIIIECVAYHKRASGLDGMNNCLHVYGNCLDRKPGVRNEDFLNVTDNGPEGPALDDWYVLPEAKTITLRGQVVTFDISESAREAKGITMVEERLTAPDLFRSLLPEHGEKFLATEEELRQRIPEDLPLLLRLDDWYHPDVARRELPSENETFQLIAKVLSKGDASLYAPTKPPNTHWKNWPDSGTL